MFSTPQLRRDSYIDYNKCKKIIYTMATCHSLRLVDGELLGDPLDIKMFEFTGWTYEEGGSANSDQSSGKGDTIIPSVARPPAMGYGDSELQNDEVGFPLALTTPNIVSLPPLQVPFGSIGC